MMMMMNNNRVRRQPVPGVSEEVVELLDVLDAVLDIVHSASE